MGVKNITTQPGETDDRKSEVIAFVINAGMKITVCSTEVPLDIYPEYVSQIQGYRWWIYRQDIERCR